MQYSHTIMNISHKKIFFMKVLVRFERKRPVMGVYSNKCVTKNLDQPLIHVQKLPFDY